MDGTETSTVEVDPDHYARVDVVAQDWRQGDIIKLAGAVHLASGQAPLTVASVRVAARTDRRAVITVGTQASDGVMVVSQTCDIVRSSAERPYVQLAPLVELDEDRARFARAFRMPRYAPVLDDSRLFVDLDRLFTVEKAILLDRDRRPTVSDDTEAKALAEHIGRKFGRFAFPNDLGETLSDFVDGVRKKYGRRSPEGMLLEQLVDILVEASPSWSDDTINVTILFVLPAGFLPVVDNPPFPSPGVIAWAAANRTIQDVAARLASQTLSAEDQVFLWQKLVGMWTERCTPVGVIGSVAPEVLNADELTYDRVLRVQRLELDHLSTDLTPR